MATMTSNEVTATGWRCANSRKEEEKAGQHIVNLIVSLAASE